MQNTTSRNEDWIIALVCMVAVLAISFFYSERTAPTHTADLKAKTSIQDRMPASLDDTIE